MSSSVGTGPLAMRPQQLVGHGGWVTAVATTSAFPDTVLTASRDRTIVKWNANRASETPQAVRSLRGHGHFVQDVVISSDGMFCLSGSWDGMLRLWDLQNGNTTRRFVGHTKDVLSVAFSSDNRQIVSGSRDKTIKLWNTLGECKYTIEQNGHTEWVSCVQFSPNPQSPVIVSCGWDKVVKVWNMSTCQLKADLKGHKDYLNTVTVSPDGSLCASGGKDRTARLWDLNEGKHLYSLDAGATINALSFSPNRYWLCAATDNGIKIWDLENKNIVSDLNKDTIGAEFNAKNSHPSATSLSWNSEGNTLYAGYTDGVVRIFDVTRG